MKRTLLTLALLATPVCAMADKIDDLKAQGFVRIAIANEPPFTAVAADGTVSGAAPDVAREIFKRLGRPGSCCIDQRIRRDDPRLAGASA